MQRAFPGQHLEIGAALAAHEAIDKAGALSLRLQQPPARLCEQSARPRGRAGFGNGEAESPERLLPSLLAVREHAGALDLTRGDVARELRRADAAFGRDRRFQAIILVR